MSRKEQNPKYEDSMYALERVTSELSAFPGVVDYYQRVATSEFRLARRPSFLAACPGGIERSDAINALYADSGRLARIDKHRRYEISTMAGTQSGIPLAALMEIFSTDHQQVAVTHEGIHHPMFASPIQHFLFFRNGSVAEDLWLTRFAQILSLYQHENEPLPISVDIVFEGEVAAVTGWLTPNLKDLFRRYDIQHNHQQQPDTVPSGTKIRERLTQPDASTAKAAQRNLVQRLIKALKR